MRKIKGKTGLLPSEGGLELPELPGSRERYLVLRLRVLEEHSAALNLLFYGPEERPAVTVRFGILPRVETAVCVDLTVLDGGTLFPRALPGCLKLVCHGTRVSREALRRVVLEPLPCFHEQKIELLDAVLTDEEPQEVPITGEKLVDEFGQTLRKRWQGRTESEAALRTALEAQADAAQEGYPFPSFSPYGGWREKRFHEGTGFFTRQKDGGRWWLVDPAGYAFFSVGPDCVNVSPDCRVGGVEPWLTWLPDRDDPVYGGMFREGRGRTAFSYIAANLRKAYGEDWYGRWRSLMPAWLRGCGLNTIGNWSDPRLFGEAGMPYVTSLREFPDTEKHIFRDFPDVFSPEYERNAVKCAESLRERREDPWMIGYFLRNEPGWAFADGLLLAEEALRGAERTVTRERLVEFLRERYGTAEALNRAWGTEFSGFDALYAPQEGLSARSERAAGDLREFSRRMLRAYVEIPSRACRAADPNHMILGMRWAWVSDPDLVTGWENFDVFSINCYAAEPTKDLDYLAKLGVDLPVMIGEFHFGALDAGPTATGLEGVRTQRDRGLAYRYYVERAASRPNGVGAHWFQCYDQFTLGRFDGENYNIGLFDVCSRPHGELLREVKSCSETLYEVAAGLRPPTEQRGESIPMIAY